MSCLPSLYVPVPCDHLLICGRCDANAFLRTGAGIDKTAATVGVGTAIVQRIRAEMGPFDASAAA
jgi:hypothetical protein